MCMTLRVDMARTGSNILRLRKEKNLSVKQIQEAMGFNTPQAIFKWQRGDSLPTLDNFVILANMLGTTIDEIVAVVN